MSDGKVNEGVDDKDASMTSQHSSEDLFAEEYNTIDPNVTRVEETETEEEEGDKSVEGETQTDASEGLPEVKRPRSSSSPIDETGDDGTTMRASGQVCTNLVLPKLKHSTSSSSNGPKCTKSVVFVQLPLAGPHTVPVPYPATRVQDLWDEDHVRMPNSSRSQFPIDDQLTGQKRLESRWKLINKALRIDPSNKIKTSYDLEGRILSYNKQGRWSFDGLKDLIDERWGDEERLHFFDSILPGVQDLALRLDSLVTQPLPLLRKGHNASITLSQLQIASLLANAFFCTFPRRNAAGSGKRNAEYSTFPLINFNRLFERGNEEKVNCLINYFRRVSHTIPRGLVTFTRRFVTPFALPDWRNSQRRVRNLRVLSQGTIEDDGGGMLQVDFANAYVGGGVLSHGCVQEEIRFAICPELIASMLFTERLGDTECLIVYGHERYSNYRGYASSFEFAGNHSDDTPLDCDSLRKKSALVAMDARPFRSRDNSQFNEENISRELNKAFVGFSSEDEGPAAVATGNWGCGAFGGDPHLKFLIQLLAASQCNRDMVYFTFGDVQLMNKLKKMHNFLYDRDTSITVGSLYKVVVSYYSDTLKSGNQQEFFDYVTMSFDFDQSTDDESEEKSFKGDLTTRTIHTGDHRESPISSKHTDLKQTQMTKFFKPKDKE